VIPAIDPSADLSNLTIQGISPISPSFTPTVYSYTDSVVSTFVQIVPTVSNAAVTINGQTANVGSSNLVLLAVGPNPITIIVTTSTGMEIYTLIVTRSTGPLVNVVASPGPSSSIAVGGNQSFTAWTVPGRFRCRFYNQCRLGE
jgi:hypothetical protein